MKILKIVLTILVIGGLAIPAASCTSESEATPAPEGQVVKVQRGKLMVDITASGNLALSLKEDLAFEISGTQQEPLTVEEVLVEAGDTVEKGQVIARLDTTSLEEKVTAQEQAVKTAELNLRTGEIGLQDAKDAEKTVKTTQIDLENAIDNYREITYPYDYVTFAFSVPEAITAVHNASLQLEDVQAGMTAGSGTEEFSKAWLQLVLARENLTLAWERLSRGIGVDQFVEYGSTALWAVEDFWTLRNTQLTMEKAQITLEKAEDSFKSGLAKAEVALAKAKQSLEEARDDLQDAKEDLEKAVIVAPFAGFITVVSVEGGDEVARGTVAAQLADPGKFEAEVMVGEMDILQLKVGDTATVKVDALPTVNIPAKVTHIAPTATIQSGVVNYTVKVEIQSLETIQQRQTAAGQPAAQGAQPGQMPERLKQAIEEGRITQEQAEEMMERRQQGQGGQPSGQGPPTEQSPQSTPQASLQTLPEDFQLREGLTVTVSVQVDERNNVLTVPNRAIKREDGETYVQVRENGAIDKRPIKTGISNFTHTEVTEGLDEGEEVIITATTSSTPTSGGGGMSFLPGIRRPR
ncbi:MAG: HlyD family efflux transporter periplasmic adaptor subunit [Chloroflexi bacterium]|nr:HlyD family efflux transporter periplasmic adaptor subunit [Chloroflexota bacterium]